MSGKIQNAYTDTIDATCVQCGEHHHAKVERTDDDDITQQDAVDAVMDKTTAHCEELLHDFRFKVTKMWVSEYTHGANEDPF